MKTISITILLVSTLLLSCTNLLNDYVQNGYKGRGIAVVKGSRIFTFNVMTKDKLDIVFNSFTNNVHFFD